MPVIADALIKLGMDVRDVRKATRQTQRLMQGLSNTVKGLGFTLGAVASVGGFGLWLKKTAEAVDQLGKLSERLGVTVRTLSLLKFAGEQAGIEFNAMATGIQRLTRRAEEFRRTGGGPAAEGFAILGEEVVDAVRRGENFEQLLPKLADGFKRLSTEQERVLAAFKLFDSEGVAFVQLLQQGSKGVSELFRKGRELGAEISGDTARAAADFNDALQEMAVVGRDLGLEVLPPVAKVLRDIADTVRSIRMRDFGEDAVDAAKKIRQEQVAKLLADFDRFLRGAGLPEALISLINPRGRRRRPSDVGPPRPEPEAAGPPAASFGQMMQSIPELAGAAQSAMQGFAQAVGTGIQQNVNTALEAMRGHLNEVGIWAQEWQVTWQNVTDTMAFGIIQFSDAVGGAFAEWIVEGANLAEAMKQLMKGVAKSIIQQLISLGVQFLLFNILGLKILGTKTTAEVKSAFAAGAAWTAASAVRDLGLIGLFGIPGFVATFAALATAGTTAAAAIGAGLGTALGPGLQHGGIVRRPILTPIGEAGPEAVIPLNRGGMPAMIVLELDGRVAGQAAFDFLPGVARRLGVRIG